MPALKTNDIVKQWILSKVDHPERFQHCELGVMGETLILNCPNEQTAYEADLDCSQLAKPAQALGIKYVSFRVGREPLYYCPLFLLGLL